MKWVAGFLAIVASVLLVTCHFIIGGAVVIMFFGVCAIAENNES